MSTVERNMRLALAKSLILPQPPHPNWQAAQAGQKPATTAILQVDCGTCCWQVLTAYRRQRGHAFDMHTHNALSQSLSPAA